MTKYGHQGGRKYGGWITRVRENMAAEMGQRMAMSGWDRKWQPEWKRIWLSKGDKIAARWLPKWDTKWPPG